MTRLATTRLGMVALTFAATLLLGGTAWADPQDRRGRRGGIDRHHDHEYRGGVRSRSGGTVIRTTTRHQDGCFDRSSRRPFRIGRAHRSRIGRLHGRHHVSHVGHSDRHRRSSCGCVEVFHPGHYVTKRVRVEDPGYYEDVWVPARYEKRRVFGIKVRVKVCGGYYKKVYRPGCVRYEDQRVWVPGKYVLETRCRRHR
ncbi:MAG: hypothetical protein AAF581_23225 [Planctomycetota bacterium]